MNIQVSLKHLAKRNTHKKGYVATIPEDFFEETEKRVEKEIVDDEEDYTGEHDFGGQKIIVSERYEFKIIRRNDYDIGLSEKQMKNPLVVGYNKLGELLKRDNHYMAVMEKKDRVHMFIDIDNISYYKYGSKPTTKIDRLCNHIREFFSELLGKKESDKLIILQSSNVENNLKYHIDIINAVTTLGVMRTYLDALDRYLCYELKVIDIDSMKENDSNLTFIDLFIPTKDSDAYHTVFVKWRLYNQTVKKGNVWKTPYESMHGNAIHPQWSHPQFLPDGYIFITSLPDRMILEKEIQKDKNIGTIYEPKQHNDYKFIEAIKFLGKKRRNDNGHYATWWFPILCICRYNISDKKLGFEVLKEFSKSNKYVNIHNLNDDEHTAQLQKEWDSLKDNPEKHYGRPYLQCLLKEVFKERLTDDEQKELHRLISNLDTNRVFDIHETFYDFQRFWCSNTFKDRYAITNFVADMKHNIIVVRPSARTVHFYTRTIENGKEIYVTDDKQGNNPFLETDIFHVTDEDGKGHKQKMRDIYTSSQNVLRVYRGIKWVPTMKELPDNYFNTFPGWFSEPYPTEVTDDDIKPWLNHIFEYFADGVEENYQYILKWLAANLQWSDRKIRTMLVFKSNGNQTAGKTLFFSDFMKLLLGSNYIKLISKLDTNFFGAFRQDLDKMKLFVLDETSIDDTKDHMSLLKNFITEMQQEKNEKYAASKQVTDYTNIIMTINGDPPPIDKENARIVMFEIKKQGSSEYYKELVPTILNPIFVSKVHRYLIENVNLENWVPLNFPKTNLLQFCISASSDPTDIFFQDLYFLLTERYETRLDEEIRDDCFYKTKTEIFQLYKSFCESNGFNFRKMTMTKLSAIYESNYETYKLIKPIKDDKTQFRLDNKSRVYKIQNVRHKKLVGK